MYNNFNINADNTIQPNPVAEFMAILVYKGNTTSPAIFHITHFIHGSSRDIRANASTSFDVIHSGRIFKKFACVVNLF